MKAKRMLIALDALLVAILACNVPGSPSFAPQPNSAGTVTAEAPILLRSSNTPIVTPTPAFSGTPTPTVSLPPAPTGLRITFRCTLSSSPFLHNDLHAKLTWQDNAASEEGYYVYRDDSLVATLGPDQTSLVDETTMVARVITGGSTPYVTYSVQAFNAAGRSPKISKSVSCFS